jgi:hypothetical protein
MTDRDIQNSEPLLKPDHLLKSFEYKMNFLRDLMETQASIAKQSAFVAEASRKNWIKIEKSYKKRLEELEKDDC